MNKTKNICTLLPLTLRAWVAVALLAIVSSFEFIKLIHLDHHHTIEVAACTESDEADACHRSIVHFDVEAGCEHPQHFEKSIADCEICDALITTYLFEGSEEFLAPIEYARIDWNETTIEKPYTTFPAFPTLRGPPALS